MRERLVEPNDGRDIRGPEPARQVRDRLHVERPVFVVDRAVIEACRLDDPGDAARCELLEPGAQRRPPFAHRPPYAVFFHVLSQASFILIRYPLGFRHQAKFGSPDQEAVHRTCRATPWRCRYACRDQRRAAPWLAPELFRQIVARPNRYGRATTCRLSATFLP